MNIVQLVQEDTKWTTKQDHACPYVPMATSMNSMSAIPVNQTATPANLSDQN